MESALMGSLGTRAPQLGIHGWPRNLVSQRNRSISVLGFGFRGPDVRCGLRGGSRRPLWRTERVMSTEAMHAVQSLKLARSSSSPAKVGEAIEGRVGRLLKADAEVVLAELRRQNEWEMALKVFAFIRKEVWYKPDLSLYSDMIFMVAKNKMTEMAEKLFSELKKEGLEPDTRAYTEMIGAFLQVGMVDKAMEQYSAMKDSGCAPDKLTLTILIRNLHKAGEEELASSVEKDCAQYIDFPERFIEEIKKQHAKRRSIKLV
ncbi:Pentatricopeptide repeat-containing protein [Acorus calamus]|uniref:Pentatricopeptide repeat-containing protein n=1 Tax=Acorus calamus TaxID=4465 RepID=A0AAV9CNT2_ACOCL|nr:Pentatricopeptide repeat-containing protein [Acorus calamus]